MQTLQQDIQLLSDFLAHRNCMITKDIHVDAIVIAGNSFPTIAKAAATYYHHISNKIIVCGGLGHSTMLLYENLEKLGYGPIDVWSGKSEAECLGTVLEHHGVSREDILLECTSTNTGANASHMKELLKISKISLQSMLLLQDPILQLRTYATFQKVFPDMTIYSYAIFKPEVMMDGSPKQDICKDVWDKSRFLSLLLGEMQRVYDDENGYGPCGKQYMIHVDVADEVRHAYVRVEHELSDFYKR